MLNNIEAERSRIGLNRTALAKELGISMTTYKNYIDEKWPVPSTILVALSRIFKCQIDYLLGLTDKAA